MARVSIRSEARACAQELGLTISSRCKLVAPEPKDTGPNPLEELQKKFKALEA